jgi:hypothetical protein
MCILKNGKFRKFIGLLNIVLFQWFFIRLAMEVDYHKQYIDCFELKRMFFIVGIIPLTGWWNDYKYLFRKE